nr:hypothetical protein [Tanacetum cinerariifolium]
MTTKFDKLVKFEGHDFRRWQKKMHFLLTTLKVVYVLSTPSPEWHEDETLETTRKRMMPVMEQFHEMLRILRQYVQYNLMMDEAISVAVIIDKLPPSWKDFKHSLKHKKEELNLRWSQKFKDNKNNKNKRKFNGGGDKSANKKSTLVCWKCNKPSHMKKDCRSRKSNDGAGSKGSNDHEKQQG